MELDSLNPCDTETTLRETISGGCEIVQVVGIVARMEGGAKIFAERRRPFRSLLSITDFGIVLPT